MQEIVQELRKINHTLERIANDIIDIRRNTYLESGGKTLGDIYAAIPDSVHLGVVEHLLDEIRSELAKGKDYSGLGSLEAKIDTLAEQIRGILSRDN